MTIGCLGAAFVPKDRDRKSFPSLNISQGPGISSSSFANCFARINGGRTLHRLFSCLFPRMRVSWVEELGMREADFGRFRRPIIVASVFERKARDKMPGLFLRVAAELGRFRGIFIDRVNEVTMTCTLSPSRIARWLGCISRMRLSRSCKISSRTAGSMYPFDGPAMMLLLLGGARPRSGELCTGLRPFKTYVPCWCCIDSFW